MLIDIVLLCRADYLLWKRERGRGSQRKKKEADLENNKSTTERGTEAGTSLLSVPNEEKRAGIIIKKPH